MPATVCTMPGKSPPGRFRDDAVTDEQRNKCVMVLILILPPFHPVVRAALSPHE